MGGHGRIPAIPQAHYHALPSCIDVRTITNHAIPACCPRDMYLAYLPSARTEQRNTAPLGGPIRCPFSPAAHRR